MEDSTRLTTMLSPAILVVAAIVGSFALSSRVWSGGSVLVHEVWAAWLQLQMAVRG